MADIVGADCEVVVSKEKSKSVTGLFPYLETEDGSVISQCEAICKHVARMNLASGIIGNTNFENAKINEWIQWSQTSFIYAMHEASQMIYGQQKFNLNQYNSHISQMQAQAKILNNYLQDKEWLVGNQITLADIYVGSNMIPAFQLIFDPGFRKGMKNLNAWFDRFCINPFVMRRYGMIMPCAKPMRPLGAPEQ